MAKFRFRFESLLAMRRSVRDERAADLAQALEAQAKLQHWIDEVKAEIDQLKLGRAGLGMLDADRILSSASYEGTLRAILAGHERDLQQVAAEAERRRQALTVANQAVRVMEKLRETQAQQHQQQLLQQEAKVLDEVATSGPVRRSISPSLEN